MLAVILVSDRFFVLPHLIVAYIYIIITEDVPLHHWKVLFGTGQSFAQQLCFSLWGQYGWWAQWQRFASGCKLPLHLIWWSFITRYQTDDQPRTFYASKLIGVLCSQPGWTFCATLLPPELFYNRMSKQRLPFHHFIKARRANSHIHNRKCSRNKKKRKPHKKRQNWINTHNQQMSRLGTIRRYVHIVILSNRRQKIS